jgi:hypothetical protein
MSMITTPRAAFGLLVLVAIRVGFVVGRRRQRSSLVGISS